MPDKYLIGVAHASKEKSSLTISIPKKVAKELGISKGDIIVFRVKESAVVIELLK